MRAHERAAAARQAAEAERAAAARMLSFGPVIDQVIQARATGTNQFLDLDTGTFLTPPDEITSALAAIEPGEDENRFWQGLDIPGSPHSQYINWVEKSGADLMFAGRRLTSFDGVFAMMHERKTANPEDWDNVRAKQVRDATAGRSTSTFRTWDLGQWDLLFFKTRHGGMGVLQVMDFTEEPSAVKIRYKFLNTAVNDSAEEREELSARLDAAAMIGNQTEKDKALSQIATAAARAGETETVSAAIDQIGTSSTRDQAALDSARLLAKHGLRKEAISIAQRIGNNTVRDLALSELAQ